MKQSKTSKLPLGKTTVSTLDKDQQSKIYGGSVSSGICESIVAGVATLIIAGIWNEGANDASKHKTK
jgi:hypothetical protein